MLIFIMIEVPLSRKLQCLFRKPIVASGVINVSHQLYRWQHEYKVKHFCSNKGYLGWKSATLDDRTTHQSCDFVIQTSQLGKCSCP